MLAPKTSWGSEDLRGNPVLNSEFPIAILINTFDFDGSLKWRWLNWDYHMVLRLVTILSYHMHATIGESLLSDRLSPLEVS